MVCLTDNKWTFIYLLSYVLQIVHAFVFFNEYTKLMNLNICEVECKKGRCPNPKYTLSQPSQLYK